MHRLINRNTFQSGFMLLSCVYFLLPCSGWKKTERECLRPAEETKRQTDTDGTVEQLLAKKKLRRNTATFFYHTRKHTLLNHAPEGFPPTSHESGNSVWRQNNEIVPNERNTEKLNGMARLYYNSDPIRRRIGADL